MSISRSHRPTAHFCRSLIAITAWGLTFGDSAAQGLRRLLLALATAATAFAFALTAGLALHFQVDLVWGVTEEVRLNYFNLRDRTDPWVGITPQ